MGHVATPLPVQGEAQAASVPQAGSVSVLPDSRMSSDPICHNVLWHVLLFDLPEGHQIMGESVCELGMR